MGKSSMRDARERKKAEEALKASEEKYRTLVESSTDAIFRLDQERKIISCNQAFYHLFGFDKNEMEGKSVRIIYPSDESFKTIGDLAYPVIDQKGFCRIEWNCMRKDGTVFPVEMVISAIKSPDGVTTGYVDIVRDIAERKKMEQDLKLANRELESFSYTVSHDLHAPLLNIAGFATLLQKSASGTLNEKNQQYLTLIQESAKRMEDLINDLLGFSRIGHVEMQKVPTSLEQLTKEVSDTFQPETKGRDITWKISPLPEVYGDPSMLRVVLTNIISNALKYTRPRQQTVIEIGCGLAGDKETVIFVRDNGVGFNMESVDKLFGVFQRLHSAKEFEGTGIGLATVQRIIQRHGGRVWAEGAVRVLVSDLPRFSGSYSAMEVAYGLRAQWMRAQPFIFLCPKSK
jgi:PAS domain S-box